MADCGPLGRQQAQSLEWRGPICVIEKVSLVATWQIRGRQDGGSLFSAAISYSYMPQIG